MTVIGEVAALDALRKAVANHGENHVVTACSYTAPIDGWDDYLNLHPDDRDGVEIAPACILGCAFHEVFGVPVETLKRMDTGPNGYHQYASEDLSSEQTLSALRSHGIELTPGAHEILEVAQKVQDNGESWGYALEKAYAYAEQLKTEGEQNDGTEGAGATA